MEVQNCSIQKLKYLEKDPEYDYYKIFKPTFLSLKNIYYEIMVYGNPLYYEYEFILSYNDTTNKIYKNSNEKEGTIIMTSDMVNLFKLENSNKYNNIEIKKLKNCYILLKTFHVAKTTVNINMSEYKTYENLKYLILDANTDEYIIKKDTTQFKYFNILYLKIWENNIKISYDHEVEYYDYYSSSYNLTKELSNINSYIDLKIYSGSFSLSKIIIFLYEDAININFDFLSNIVLNELNSNLKFYHMNVPNTKLELYFPDILIFTTFINNANFTSTMELEEFKSLIYLIPKLNAYTTKDKNVHNTIIEFIVVINSINYFVLDFDYL